MKKFVFVGGTTPNKYGDLGVTEVPCLEDGTADPESPYVKFNFRLYLTRKEAERALAVSTKTLDGMKKESESLACLAPLGNDGAKHYSRPHDWDAARFWRD